MISTLRRTLLTAFLGASAATSFATKQVVTVQNFNFTPSTFSICVGDTVQWQWLNGSHTTTSSTLPAGATAWNSNMTSATTTFTYVPTVAGTYNYVCTPHASSGMTGTFTVTATPTQPAVTPTPSNATGCQGIGVALSSTTNPNANHRWYFNGTAITTGGTGNTYVALQAGAYSLRDSTGCGAVTSNNVVVTINPTPASPVISQTHTAATYTFTSTAPSTGVLYSWNFGDGTAASTAQNPPAHTYTTSGPKIVTLTIATTSGCSNVGTLTVNPSLGIGTVVGHTVYSLSPNPATSLISLRNGANTVATLYDATGRMIAVLKQVSTSGNDAQYDVHEYAAGLYLLHISTPQGEGVLRLQIAK